MSATTGLPLIRLRDAFTAEVTKIITNPTTILMLTITLAANLILGGIDASGVTFYTGGPQDPSTLSSFGIVMLTPIYAFLVLPVHAAASEHRGGQLRISLTATPDRGTFVLAKLTAMIGVIIIAAIIALVPARLVIAFSDGLGTKGLLIDTGRWITVYALMSLIVFGLAGLLRSAIAALGIIIALPIILATGILQWPAGVRFLPDQASLSLLGTPGYDVTELRPGTAGLVLIAWAMTSVAVYAFALIRRDA